jgi:hypothetical protein
MNRVEKYIQKYGLNSAPLETGIKECRYAVVVPAIAEFENIKKFLHSFSQQDNKYFNETLLLFVINNARNADESVKEDNRNSILFLRSIINGQDDYLTGSNLNIGVIDSSTEGNELPEKDAGVGLARKIGMDSALRIIKDNGILICTDADCTFSNNYLTEIVNNFSLHKTDAAVIKFRHNVNDEETADAVINYEIFLRYYVLGLKFSDSPFAFHTVGSSMACSSEAYTTIEGMNKRKAAEDFYFLEKLAKNYPVKKIDTAVVYPSSRKSWRVPFGTGQRVNRFVDRKKDEYVLYHPECFRVLADWHKIFFNNDIFSAAEYLAAAKAVNNSLFDFLSAQGFEKDWQNILRNCRTQNLIKKQKIRWFDGFRTLKLVHYLRDNYLNEIPMFDALDELLKCFLPGMV